MEPLVIEVYKDRGVWVFNDPEHGMQREPLVFGMERLLDRFSATLPYADDGFLLYFLEVRVPDSIEALIREEADADGYWYNSPHYELRGWMGNSGLVRYFSRAPATIYYHAKPRSDLSGSQL